MNQPADLHEWVSFEDEDEQRTWMFDATFLTSSWTCIFGRGCKGILSEDATDSSQGCCSHGAHMVGPEDIRLTEERARQLTASQWQFRDEGLSRGVVVTDEDGISTTRLIDDACIFLNRVGFDGDGIGCAFHHAAEASDLTHADLMPEVCWQLPLRRVDKVDDCGHVISTIREWKRRDWGEGGADFHWWCTETPDAFVGDRPVYLEMEQELRELTTDRVYEQLSALLRERGRGVAVAVPHPALRTG